MTEREREVTPPRVLEIDLTARGARPALRVGPFAAREAALERVAARSGAALALALIAREASAPDAQVPLVLAVGDCVRRGLPTAARAGVASRAPLSGRFADGQVGGDLGRRLASVADALLLRGRCARDDALLIVDERGAARLESPSGLRGASPRERLARLAERFPAAAALCTGPAGERDIPFASLAAGPDVAHFVGRGGLGAVLARHGLAALVVEAPEVAPAPASSLATALARSPRLAARAAGGTLELFEAHAARGGVEAARAIGAQLRGAARERHGCAGCPTPCGWAFERPRAAPQPARFGATFALGLRLGLERADDALALLARCDDAGLDAKELGAALAILGSARARGRVAGEPLLGESAACERALDELLAGRGEGARLAVGAAALARQFGLEHELSRARSSASEDDVAARLAAAVGTRGGDPQRAFPFLVHDGAEGALLEALLAPLRLPAGGADPRDPSGKGLLLWWHENLSAAIDSTGFCAFSAAALLCDGSLGLDDLARWIAPDASRAAGVEGRELLAQGAEFLHLARRLDEDWGAAPQPPSESELAGPWREYARLRGLDERGRLTPRSRALFAAGRLGTDVEAHALVARSAPPPEVPAAVARGRVRLRCGEPLAQVLGGESELELDLPAPLSVVLAALALRAGPAADLLTRDGRSLAVVYRAGERLAPTQAVRDGDLLELLLVISGGAR